MYLCENLFARPFETQWSLLFCRHLRALGQRYHDEARGSFIGRTSAVQAGTSGLSSLAYPGGLLQAVVVVRFEQKMIQLAARSLAAGSQFFPGTGDCLLSVQALRSLQCVAAPSDRAVLSGGRQLPRPAIVGAVGGSLANAAGVLIIWARDGRPNVTDRILGAPRYRACRDGCGRPAWRRADGLSKAATRQLGDGLMRTTHDSSKSRARARGVGDRYDVSW
jgi:hypothetical protein